MKLKHQATIEGLRIHRHARALLMWHFRRGNEVWFITARTPLASLVELTAQELHLCRNKLRQFPWTWIFRRSGESAGTRVA